MKTEQLVCSLEISKKLKGLGVLQESNFYYEHYSDAAHIIVNIKNEYRGASYCSAFTAAELMEMMPEYIDTRKNEPFNGFRFDLQLKKIYEDVQYKKMFSVNYHCDTFQFEATSIFFNFKLIKHDIYHENMAECIAKLLLYLLENGYIKL